MVIFHSYVKLPEGILSHRFNILEYYSTHTSNHIGIYFCTLLDPKWKLGKSRNGMYKEKTFQMQKNRHLAKLVALYWKIPLKWMRTGGTPMTQETPIWDYWAQPVESICSALEDALFLLRATAAEKNDQHLNRQHRHQRPATTSYGRPW